MTCPIMVHLGVFALGAADPRERTLVENHLPDCAECRAELARLAPLSELLSRIPVGMLADDEPLADSEPLADDEPLAGSEPLPVRPARLRRARARYKAAAMSTAVAAAAVGIGLGLWLASPPGGSQAAVVTLSAANPATHVQATVTLTATGSGSSISLQADGLPLKQPCRLIIHSRSGGTEVTPAWYEWSPGPASIPASSSWRPSDIASLQVATPAGSLVTITARATP